MSKKSKASKNSNGVALLAATTSRQANELDELRAQLAAATAPKVTPVAAPEPVIVTPEQAWEQNVSALRAESNRLRAVNPLEHAVFVLANGRALTGLR